MSCMFWLARKYGDAAVADAEHALLEDRSAQAEHVVWYVPPSGKEAPRDLDRHFRSPVDIVVMRSAWDDPNALFVGVKGGYNQVNHGHLDLGNFELDALGVRWARDLGADDYNLPRYWDKAKGGVRWQYYRMRSASHNVPMLDGKDQDEEAAAKVTSFESRPDEARVTIDLTSAYPEFASSALREVALVSARREVEIRDRFELSAPCDVLWGMTTDAVIEIRDSGDAVLTQDGKRLFARILSPEGAVFSEESAEQAPPERENKGVRRLVLRTSAPAGPLEVTVRLVPDWENAAE